MKIITRYLASEWTKWFVLFFLALYSLLFLQFLTDYSTEFYANSLSICLQEFIYLAFSYLSWLFPVSCFIATIFTISNLGKNNRMEILVPVVQFICDHRKLSESMNFNVIAKKLSGNPSQRNLCMNLFELKWFRDKFRKDGGIAFLVKRREKRLILKMYGYLDISEKRDVLKLICKQNGRKRENGILRELIMDHQMVIGRDTLVSMIRNAIQSKNQKLIHFIKNVFGAQNRKWEFSGHSR